MNSGPSLIISKCTHWVDYLSELGWSPVLVKEKRPRDTQGWSMMKGT